MKHYLIRPNSKTVTFHTMPYPIGASSQEARSPAMKLVFGLAYGPANLILGKTFMFTGHLDSMTRHQAQEEVRKLGGLAGGEVSRNTDYLVVGDKPDSKLGHAIALGITQLSEPDFLEMLEGQTLDDGQLQKPAEGAMERLLEATTQKEETPKEGDTP